MQYTSKKVYLPGNHYTSRQVYEYISRQTNDPIVEWKTCVVSGTQFPIFQSDLDFYAKISPTFAGITYQIPTPTLCPEERQRRRLSFRNERKLYRRQCDASKKSIISIYSPDKPYKVYDQKIRWSDAWDPMEYGMDFDFSRTFTEQFRELMIQIPKASLSVETSENSDYSNYTGWLKNCYLVYLSAHDEGCMYSHGLRNSDYCFDCNYTRYSQNSYELIDCTECHDSKNLLGCIKCNECSYSQYLESCNNCIFCNSLNHKKYHILNKSYNPSEYFAISQQIFGDYKIFQEYQEKYKQLITAIYQANKHQNSQNTYGNHIYNCSKVLLSNDIYDSNYCKYCTRMFSSNECMDTIDWGNKAEYCYECHKVGDQAFNIIFSAFCLSNINNLTYCYDCVQNTNNLFGCIGLRNKSYCIFNKQYTKEEYEELVGKIIRHMQTTGERGEFFHPSLSPFGYNETVAQEYYELQNVQKGSDAFVLKDSENSVNFGIFGYHRSTYNADPSIPEGVQTIERKNYSDEQRNFLLQEDNLETKVFLCSVSARPYRLQKAEIEFYRKHHLPIPDKHPDVRHEERMKLRPGRTLFLRTCDCCGKEMLSVYPQEHEGKVYCEECYQKEVYS